MPNFSSLAGLEVAEKFLWGGGGWVGGVVCTVIFVSNPTVVLRLGWGWGFDNNTAGLVKLISRAKCSVKTREASREANTLHYQISLSYRLGARSDL